MGDMTGSEEPRHITSLVHLGVHYGLPRSREVPRWGKRQAGGCLRERKIKERKGKNVLLYVEGCVHSVTAHVLPVGVELTGPM